MADHNDTGATARPWRDSGDRIFLPDGRQLIGSVITDPAIRWMIVESVNAYEPLKARLAEVEMERDDIRSTLNAWFNTSNKLEPDVSKLLLDGLNLYIRRSESGGMPFKLADDLRAVLADFCRLYVGNLLTPYIERSKGEARALAAEQKED